MSIAPDIFLSYNREDQAVARRFAQAFVRALRDARAVKIFANFRQPWLYTPREPDAA